MIQPRRDTSHDGGAVETPGRKTMTWNGLNNSGQQVATGVYFYRMTAPGFEKTRKMVIMIGRRPRSLGFTLQQGSIAAASTIGPLRFSKPL
jgi:hypothetical protein